MSRTIIDILLHETGKFRVVIFQCTDGSFGFEDQKFSDEPLEQCWIPTGRHSECFCDSVEQAVTEARTCASWLAHPAGTPPKGSP